MSEPSSQRPPTPHPRPGIAVLLSLLGGHASRAWTRRLAEVGLEPREALLFRFVALSEGHSQRDVAEAIGLPASRIVGLVDRLEANGWVERRSSASDRRTHALHVTATGWQVLEQVEGATARHEADLTSGLTDEERATLGGLLESLARGLGLAEGHEQGLGERTAASALMAATEADPLHAPDGDPAGEDRRRGRDRRAASATPSDARPG